MNKHVDDLFVWAQTLESTGNSSRADVIMAQLQLQRSFAGLLHGITEILKTAKREPQVLDGLIASLEGALK